ncbi:hypothetical protein TcBrA4_0126300 [Trypanosoma cruzi]|nr:hypothetical protein TcBrA4_0126300 [Trypanosoma cruzi]
MLRRRPRRRCNSTEDIVPADAERELSEPAEDAEKEAVPPLHSTEDIVPADCGEGAERSLRRMLRRRPAAGRCSQQRRTLSLRMRRGS